MNERLSFSWEIDVPLLTNRWVFLDGVKVLVWTYLLVTGLMALIFAAMGDAADILPLLWILAIAVAGLALLGFLVMGLVFGNRFRMRFTLDPEGVWAETLDRRAKFINRLPAGGSALLAQSREDQSLPWKAVARVSFDPGSASLALHNRWRRVMVVYCPHAEYPQISAFAQEQVNNQGATLRRQRNPVPARLLWSTLVILACLPLFQMPYRLEIDALLPILLLCFALATLWLVRFLGWVMLGGSLYGIVMTLVKGFQVYQAELFPFLGAHTTFAWLDVSEWFQLALAWLGLIFLIVLAIQALRNRLPSMLEMDETGPD